MSDHSSVDILVAAWTYAAAQQVFDFTRSKLLPESRLMNEVGKKSTASHSEKRSDRRSHVGQNTGKPSSGLAQNVNQELANKISKAPGLLKASANRADLCMIQRRILEKILTWREWNLKKTSTFDEEGEESERSLPDLNATSDEPPKVNRMAPLLERLPSSSLHDATCSVDELKKEYEVSID